MVQFLVGRGADIHVTDRQHGMTPLHHAAAGGHREVVEFLGDRGADIQKADMSERTLLQLLTKIGTSGPSIERTTKSCYANHHI